MNINDFSSKVAESLSGPEYVEGMYIRDDERAREKPEWVEVKPGFFEESNKTFGKLRHGLYDITWDSRANLPLFIKKDLKLDKLIEHQSGFLKEVFDEIYEFWNRKEVFKKAGFLHRRGYLFYGNAGVGKTALISMLMLKILKKDGLIFVCDYPKHFIEGLKTFRKLEPERPIICIFEDVDAIISKYGDKELLSLLDGDNQIDGVLNIASSNYPEKLDKRIVARPRRFDRIIKIESPDSKTREKYFKQKGIKDYKHWAKISEGLSFASLAELIISVQCLGNPLEDTLKILIKMKTTNVSSTEDKTLGFGQNNK